MGVYLLGREYLLAIQMRVGKFKGCICFLMMQRSLFSYCVSGLSTKEILPWTFSQQTNTLDIVVSGCILCSPYCPLTQLGASAQTYIAFLYYKESAFWKEIFTKHLFVFFYYRMAYAFSRDGAMPFSRLWHTVNRWDVPLNAVWLSAVVAFIMALTVC